MLLDTRDGSHPEQSADDMLPSQWLDQLSASFNDRPERRLLIAILFDAMRVLRSGGLKQRSEITAWIRGTNAARIPFRFLCESLDLEPIYLERRLLQATRDAGPRLRSHARRKRTPHVGDSAVPVEVASR